MSHKAFRGSSLFWHSTDFQKRSHISGSWLKAGCPCNSPGAGDMFVTFTRPDTRQRCLGTAPIQAASSAARSAEDEKNQTGSKPPRATAGTEHDAKRSVYYWLSDWLCGSRTRVSGPICTKGLTIRSCQGAEAANWSELGPGSLGKLPGVGAGP